MHVTYAIMTESEISSESSSDSENASDGGASGDESGSESDDDKMNEKLKRPGFWEVRKKHSTKECPNNRKPPPPPINNSPEDSDTDSSAWETEDEKEKSDNIKPSSPNEKGDDDIFNPFNFGYVNLTRKVIEDYESRHLSVDPTMTNTSRRKNRSARFANADSKKVTEPLKERIRKGGDLQEEFVAAPPLLLNIEDRDLLGIKEVEKILDAPDLTIEQKYRCLDVEDDPWADDIEYGSCWQWLRYKFSRMYYAQWPAHFFN